MTTQHLPIAAATRTAWMYRNFDFLTILVLSAKFLSIGVMYMNRLESGMETNLWFWIPALAGVLPYIVTLGIIKGIFRREVLRYSEMGLIRNEAGLLIEADGDRKAQIALLSSRLDQWTNLMKISFWITLVFYVSVRIIFLQGMGIPMLWLVDLMMVLGLVAMVGLSISHHRALQ